MTNEEVEKVMNFLIQRQEVFAGNLERMEKNMADMQDTVAVLVQSHTKLVEAQTEAQRDLAMLARVVTDLTKIITGGRNGEA